MNARERFLKVMHFEPVDRIPLWDLEGFTEGAIRRWTTEGLPVGMDVRNVFRADPLESVPLDTGPIPSFFPHVVEEDEEYITHIDQFGFTVKTSKSQSVTPTTYYYVRGSVDTLDDWQRMKERYDPHDLRRRPKFWGEELLTHYRETESPVRLTLVWGPGRGPKNGYTLGLERFLTALKEEPELVHDIFAFWSEFTIELIRELFEKGKVDLVWFSEDGLAYKNSTVISPETYREFWTPHIKPVIDFIRSHGTDVVGFYTSGNITPLIPAFMETGFNCFGPLEVAADLDARQLRKEFGKEVLLMGNIGRAALMAGPEAVEKEFEEKVPWMMETGGCIPAVDDMILPDISFESYKRYFELMSEFRMG